MLVFVIILYAVMAENNIVACYPLSNKFGIIPAYDSDIIYSFSGSNFLRLLIIYTESNSSALLV